MTLRDKKKLWPSWKTFEAMPIQISIKTWILKNEIIEQNIFNEVKKWDLEVTKE